MLKEPEEKRGEGKKWKSRAIGRGKACRVTRENFNKQENFNQK